MPLLAFWESNAPAVSELSIEQVVASAGDGTLKDTSVCSDELRKYLAQIPSNKIADYVEHCLESGFVRSGLVLQDLINELGRRLDYKVSNGRYQGTAGGIGYDGIWISPEGHTIVAEVKTTDAYRISLNTIAAYRNKLKESDQISGPTSILIIVGREDTGELEAQVRGSRHAWDIRLISAEALIKLVQLKENSDGPETGQKIRSLLTPMEYTRLDPMIDVMFTTAKDVEAASTEVTIEQDKEERSETPDDAKGTWQFTDSRLLDQKREKIVAALGRHLHAAFVRKSRALYWDANHQHRLVCTISKRYNKGDPYWYAYHPQWDDFLKDGTDAYFVLGCMDLSVAFAVPRTVLHPLLETLHTTTTKDGHVYWHIHLIDQANQAFAMRLPKKGSALPLGQYQIKIDA
jgi:hypothetical protein